jgi:hypothetical protein
LDFLAFGFDDAAISSSYALTDASSVYPTYAQTWVVEVVWLAVVLEWVYVLLVRFHLLRNDHRGQPASRHGQPAGKMGGAMCVYGHWGSKQRELNH